MYTPEKVLDNKYFESIVDTTDEWIMTRTGIKEEELWLTGLQATWQQKGLPRFI